MSFANNLKQGRVEKELTQEQFAELLGVSRQAVSKWELGDGYPEVEKLISLVKMLGVSLDWLFEEEVAAEQPVGDSLENFPGIIAGLETFSSVIDKLKAENKSKSN